MGNEKKEARVDVKSRLGKLCEDIGTLDKRGVNVNQAWKLYEKANNLTKQMGEENQILQYINQAEADLKRKEVMCRWSTRWRVVIFCVALVVILGFGPAVFYVYCWQTDTKLLLILGAPVFLIVWGYVGSAAYVLISIGKRISQRLLDPQKFPEYYFRLILGAIFAGAIYYILQLGLLSLPPTVSKEVSASLEKTQIEQKEQKVKELDENKKKLESEIEILTGKSSGEGSISKLGIKPDGEVKKEPYVTKEKKEELVEIEKILEREGEQPIWESAFYVVIAFFSGFSVNFVNSVFNRALRGILGTKQDDSQSGEGVVEEG